LREEEGKEGKVNACIIDEVMHSIPPSSMYAWVMMVDDGCDGD
jgi:hypothetical protein